ncbi:hypothetical protein F0562_005751 [Nyssa sinensis]|uniref:DUF4219 domain-containing protein n=1 Tax=Nyssa sinensis TaxID=561372 RepID=A0A5J5AMP1_9ASTE|nr:hypothetical protein F0562_005751 [Nyssa sinensis]
METGNGAMLGIVPEQLTEDNYEYWKVCLKSYLVSQGLWDVVSGRKPKPEKRSPDYESWRRQNAQALHAIQLSCGSDLYFQFRKTHIAKEAWDRLAEKRRRPVLHLPLSDHEEDPVHMEHHGSPDHLDYNILFKAVENGDWKGVKTFLKDDPTAVSARISSKGDTALHVAILTGQIKIAEELVKLTPAEDLELTDEFGCTTLSLAAISGVTRLAKALVQKNHNLLRIANEHDDGLLPVTVASLYGRKRMVRYLYSVTPQEEISPERGEPGATLLNCLITAEIYDVAADLLHRYPQLAFTKDHYENYTLRVLAHKPSAFPSGCKLVFWKKWIYSCINVHLPWDADEHECESPHAMDHRVPSLLHRMGWILLRCFVPDIKHLYDRKLVHHEVHELLGCIFKEIPKLSRSKLEQMGIDDAIYDAIKHGIIEFVVEILKYNPDIIWRKDNKGRTIFSHAIVLRQEKIFSLIHGFGTKKCIMARRHDIFRNNFLHLAAKLSPPNQLERVNGAALQMQRELQWFKEVESMVFYLNPSAIFQKKTFGVNLDNNLLIHNGKRDV